MEDVMPQSGNPKPLFFRRRWFIVLATVAALFLLLLVVLPYGISYGLLHWIKKSGGDTALVEDVDFNIFNGKAAIRQLSIDSTGRGHMSLPRLALDVDWLPLLSRQVLVRSLDLDGVALDITVDAEGGVTIGGIGLHEAAAEEEAVEAAVWGFGLDRLDIRDSSVNYRAPDLEIVLHLDSFSLSNLKTWATEPAQLTLEGTVNGSTVKLEGELPPLSTGFGYRGRLSLGALGLDAFAKAASTAVAGLAGSVSADTELEVLLPRDQAMQFSQRGTVRIADLALVQDDNRLKYDRIAWQGDIDGQIAAGEPPRVKSQGVLNGERLSVVAPAASLELHQEALHWEGTAAFGGEADDQAMQFSQRGTLRIADLELVQDDNRLKYDRIAWKGDIDGQIPAGEPPRVKSQGVLNGERLSVVAPAAGLELHQEALRWEGTAAFGGEAQAAVTVDGSLQAGGTRADVQGTRVELARLESLALDRIVMAGPDQLDISGLLVKSAVFMNEQADGGEAASPVLVAGAISVDKLRLEGGNQLDIDVLEWRDVTSVARREPGGEWRVIRLISTLPFSGGAGTGTGGAPAAETTPGAPAAGRVRVKELRVTGDSTLVLDDGNVSPPFQTRISMHEVVLQEIDSGAPEQDARIVVRGETDRHSRIDVRGTIRPFAEKPTLDLQGQLEAIALTSLSPYTVTALGYSLQSGHLDADSSLKIRQGELDITNKLTIRGLEVKPAQHSSREKLDSQLSVPLDTALDMLRDKHNTIRLDLPVKGNLEHPDFDISNVVNTAVSKALKKGSMTYLTMALQPYGALITLAQMAGEAAAKVRLEPVSFAAGSAQLQGDTDGYLEKVAGILKDRPEINIKVCGVAVAGDRQALADAQATASTTAKDSKDSKDTKDAILAIDDAQLLELAKQRADNVKDMLVSRYSAKSSQLVACQPAISDGEEEGAPRVELLI